MKILVTGGTGTVGTALTRQLLRNPKVESIRVMGRSEYRTLLFKRAFGSDPRLDVVTGDVADFRSMELNCHGMDQIFHLAAMKHVDLIEKDPHLAMWTNIEGTKNAVEAALRTGVKRFVLMSTDKVVHASSLYGATKLIAEKITLAANRVRPMFNVFRSGNVLNSSGSVLEVWKAQIKASNAVQVTDPAMTRFFLPQEDLAQRLEAMTKRPAGVIYVPKSEAFLLEDLTRVVIGLYGKKTTKVQSIGRRPGEKLHEELISVEELGRTTEHKDHFLVTPDAVAKPLERVPSSEHYLIDRKRLAAIVKPVLRSG